MAYLLANNAVSTLLSGITTGATTLTVQSGAGTLFPSPTTPDVFQVTLANPAGTIVEVCTCTARSGDVLTVTRAQESTAAAAFNPGDKIELRLTAAVIASLVTTKWAAPGAIGSTTPNTGAFTTLNATGQLLLNTTTGNNSANRLLVKGAVGDDRIAVETANTGSLASLEAQDTGYYTTPTYSGTAVMQFGAAYAGTTAGVANAGLGVLRFQNNTGGLIYTNNAVPIVFGTAAVERMRISSSGQVGIAMPPNGNSQLQVSQASSPYGIELLAAVGGANVGSAIVRLLNNANTVERMTIAATSDTFSYIGAASQFALFTAGAERMRIAATGEVGIGGAPAGSIGLTVYGTNSQVLSQATAGFGSFYAKGSGANSAYVFLGNVTNGEQARIEGNANQLIFYTSNAATERLRLDATNLTTALSIIAGPSLTTGVGVSTGACGIEIGGNRTGIGAAYIDFHGTNGTDFEARIIRNSGVNGSMDYNNLGTGGHNFYNNSGLGLVISSTGSVTATQSLTLGIGGSYVAGSIYSDANWGMLFRSKQAAPVLAEYKWSNSVDTELMRLTSAGGIIAVGTVIGSNLSGTNTGDSAANTTYAADYRAANFVAGTNYLAPTGSAAGLTGLLSAQVPWATPGAIGSTTPSTGVFTSLTGSTIQDTAGNELGFKGLPSASVTTGAFIASDRGKCVYATAGVTVPNATMATGDVVTIINTTAAAVTITATVTTLRLAGVGTTGSRTLAAYGIASVVFNSSTSAFISGNVT